MAQFVPVANTIQAEMRQTLGGEQIMNVLHFEKTTQPTVSDMTAIGSELIDWWANDMAIALSTSVELIEVYLTDLTSQIGATVSQAPLAVTTGSIGIEPMSANVAACISFKTSFRGRSFQGRNYIAGLPHDKVNLNIIEPLTMGILRTGYAQLANIGTALNFGHVVVSRYSGVTIVAGRRVPTPRVAGITSPVITYKFTTNSVRTQRRRLP